MRDAIRLRRRMGHAARRAGLCDAAQLHLIALADPEHAAPERVETGVDLTATNTPAPVTASDEFTTPGTWGFEPAKSATMPSPSTVSSIRTSTGSSRPSS